MDLFQGTNTKNSMIIVCFAICSRLFSSEIIYVDVGPVNMQISRMVRKDTLKKFSYISIILCFRMKTSDHLWQKAMHQTGPSANVNETL